MVIFNSFCDDNEYYIIIGLTTDDIINLTSGYKAKFKSELGNFVIYYGKSDEQICNQIKKDTLIK